MTPTVVRTGPPPLDWTRNIGGNNNIAIGEWALYNCRTGSENIAIGRHAGMGLQDESRVIAIVVHGREVRWHHRGGPLYRFAYRFLTRHAEAVYRLTNP